MFAMNYRMQIDDNEKISLLRQLADHISSLWVILDKELEKKRFITGDEPTIVDYLATIYTSWGHNFPDIKITFGKNVEKLVEHVSALPEFQASYRKENIEFKKVV